MTDVRRSSAATDQLLARRRQPWVPVVYVAAALALALWSAADAWVGAVRDRMPDAALRIYPNDPLALAKRASLSTEQRQGVEPSMQAQADARAAVRMLALNPRALRVIAIAQAGKGDDRKTLRLLEASERINRRDLPTQLMLIETSVARGDIGAALTHYDRALRVSPDVGTLLFPTMAAASNDIGPRGSILALIARNPPWLPQFVDWITHYAPTIEPLLPVLERMSPSWQALDAEHQRLLIARLVKEGDPVGAVQLYRHFRGKLPSAGSLAFDTMLPPLDWEIATEGDRSGVVNKSNGSLTYYVEGNTYGSISRRLLTLPAGRYAINTAGTSDLSESARWPVWNVRCAADDTSLGSAIAAIRPRTVSPAALVTIPPGCSAQWLDLSVPSSADRSQSGEIMPVMIRRIG